MLVLGRVDGASGAIAGHAEGLLCSIPDIGESQDGEQADGSLSELASSKKIQEWERREHRTRAQHPFGENEKEFANGNHRPPIPIA
ncbi:hypothetical protein Cni_G13505 [Canna indica]|uniref:Uncharacterized protein n=1 Tax=Canna indica TaxID=4628 RepID=A0AAQ3QD53_9LILI|nr:hypothetical protein Cni_G13505 [Canna indica]